MIEKNPDMSYLLEDCSIQNPLLCRSYITKNAVDLMLRYYGGVAININENNVLDLLVICVEWKEEKLGKICLKYLFIFILIINVIDI